MKMMSLYIHGSNEGEINRSSSAVDVEVELKNPRLVIYEN